MVLSIIGLGFNFVGTVLVAFSIRKGAVTIMKETAKKPKWESTVNYYPGLFYTGITFLAVGFALQFISQLPCLN